MKRVKGLFLSLFLILVSVLVLTSCSFDDFKDFLGGLGDNKTEQPIDKPVEEPTTPTYSDDGIVENIKYDNLQIHFMELGNKYTGDSVYIKAGDNDILIDAGSRKGSAFTINNYIKKYMTDNKFEYVIATHAHQDHIAGMIGIKSKGIYDGILYSYDVDNLIDFATVGVSSETYSDYLTAVEYRENNGTIHHTADYFFENDKLTPKPEAHITLGEDISMDILWNKYYFEYSGDDNDSSVCVMLNYKEHHFMFTGDLEEEGETQLANYYDNSTDAKTLPTVDLFKGGHHGSYTASNDILLSKIKPRISVCCCCAGSTEYAKLNAHTFPSQEYIDRISKYTDRVYITTLYVEDADAVSPFHSFNGNICVSSDGENIGLYASNNLTKLKDSDWIKQEVYVDSKGNLVAKDSSGAIKVPRRTIPKAWQNNEQEEAS